MNEEIQLSVPFLPIFQFQCLEIVCITHKMFLNVFTRILNLIRFHLLQKKTCQRHALKLQPN